MAARLRRHSRTSAAQLHLCSHGTALLRLLHRGLGGLEAELGVRAVAERLVHRTAAAAERDARLTGEVVGVAVRVGEFELAEVAFHAEGAVLLGSDPNLSHRSSDQSYRRNIIKDA